MAEVFGHDYELYIGQPSQLIEKHLAPTGFEGQMAPNAKAPEWQISSVTGGYIDYVTIPSKAKKIVPPIQMTAEIKYGLPKQGGKSVQKTKISIYNLSKDTLKAIEADAAVILKAGYKTDKTLPDLYVGQVISYSTARVGSDNVTTVICKEAHNLLKNTRYVGSFPENTAYYNIFLELMDKMADAGVPLGEFSGNERSGQKTEDSVEFSGKLEDFLTQMCDAIDFVWFVTKGRLYIQPSEYPRATAFVTPKPNQVIGSVTPWDNKAGKTSSDKSTAPKGIEVTSALDAAIDLSVYYKMDKSYPDFEGDYKISEIVHDLDWHNGPWTTTVRSQQVKSLS